MISAREPQRVRVDYDGDGQSDYDGPPGEASSFTYTNAGLHIPGATLEYADGTQKTIHGLIRAYDRDLLDAELRSKWNRMKAAIQAGDFDRALEPIAVRKRQAYRAMIGSLSPERRASIETVLPDLRFIGQTGFHLEYEMLRADPDGRVFSYMVLFVLDDDGVWRLQTF